MKRRYASRGMLWFNAQLAPKWPWLFQWVEPDGTQEAACGQVQIAGAIVNTARVANDRGQVSRYVVVVDPPRGGTLVVELLDETELGRFGAVHVRLSPLDEPDPYLLPI